MIIEKPSNRDERRGTDSHHNCLNQPSAGGVRITETDLFGKKIMGILVAVDDAGAPIVIISEGKFYERCTISGYFYCSDLMNWPPV